MPEDDEPQQPALEAAIAEVDTEEETEDGSVVVELRTKNGTANADIHVPRSGAWDVDAWAAIDVNRNPIPAYNEWAKLVLSDRDWDRWRDLRPNMDEANAFFGRWAELSGESAGKSRPSSRALRRARRR